MNQPGSKPHSPTSSIHQLKVATSSPSIDPRRSSNTCNPRSSTASAASASPPSNSFTPCCVLSSFGIEILMPQGAIRARRQAGVVCVQLRMSTDRKLDSPIYNYTKIHIDKQIKRVYT